MEDLAERSDSGEFSAVICEKCLAGKLAIGGSETLDRSEFLEAVDAAEFSIRC